ncbi:HD-GYP domain-containing protein [Piscirickettsia litoralis]|nr:HD domain-containing phosphohydrolase [Piscirickettsia litoralis]
MSSVIELSEKDYKGFSANVAHFAKSIALNFKLDEEQIEQTYFACLLMGIGKISLAEKLVKTPYLNLAKEDQKHYEKHSERAESCLASIEALQPVSKIIRHIYENYNGSGYPDRLKAEHIPLPSRIIRICSDYFLLKHGLITAEKMTTEDALAYIDKNLDQLYDRELFCSLKSHTLTLEKLGQDNQQLKADELEVGMIIAKDLESPTGGFLLPAGTLIDHDIINKLSNITAQTNQYITVEVRPFNPLKPNRKK